MRPGAAAFDAAASAPIAPAASGGPPHSAWHSPVPYLFGGLAAMLGLIAFALLILACSYWKLSGYLDADGGGDAGGDSSAVGGGDAAKPGRFFEESIVVIMAGDCKPTFLATPTCAAVAAMACRCGDAAAAGVAEEDGRKAGEAARSRSDSDCNQGEVVQNAQQLID